MENLSPRTMHAPMHVSRIPHQDSGSVSTGKAFIEANTVEMSMRELRDNHIIPVFSATNEPLISHHDFIHVAEDVARNWFQGENVLSPNVRVSHPIKGRIPEAKYKKASELEPWEETLFYERMMFTIEVPSISELVNGNELTLTLGGVKSYNQDNLYGKRPSSEQHFQLFIGFKNLVCTNLCVSTDGVKKSVFVRSLEELAYEFMQLIQSYNHTQHIEIMRQLNLVTISEKEFAQLIGKCRLYRYLPDKTSIVPLLFGDQQMGAVAKDYFVDENFQRDEFGEITLWRMYNLFTGVNKSTYIDNFLERAINAQEIVMEVLYHKLGRKSSWYLE
jgi:hypothetical protein